MHTYPSRLTVESLVFLGVNRGKLDVILNLKQTEDRKRLLALVASMFDFPQLLQEDMIATYARTTVGSCRGVNRAMTFGRTPGPEPFAAPDIDQHGILVH